MIRAIDKWFVGYVLSVLRRPRPAPGNCHVLFCIADHFEPFRGGVDRSTAVERVRRWREDYPRFAEGLRDADGLPPRHTFFYPADEYDPECVDLLADLCRQGYGEVEIHLHHRHDTPSGLREKLERFRDVLRNRHGLLGTDAAGNVRYGFVHGNWALCNSRPDGDWCGVNEELTVLRETGCYADFTFPSAPSPTQPRMVNALYYARGRGTRPRNHDRGVLVRESLGAPAESLLLITGPLGLNWRRRKWGVFPGIENGAISAGTLPSRERMRLWLKQHIHVLGRPDWLFIKVHTHGCVPANRAVLLGTPMRELHDGLRMNCGDKKCRVLHYVTCRELYNMVRAAGAGTTGNPGTCRDYEVHSPMGAG